MTFSESIGTCLSKLIIIKGRASRSEFWWYQLFLLLVLIIVGVPLIFTTGSDMVVTLIQGTLGLLALSAQIRRLHDIDKSGWWFLIGFVPLIGGIVLLVFFCLKGSDGENRFGKDPLSSL